MTLTAEQSQVSRTHVAFGRFLGQVAGLDRAAGGVKSDHDDSFPTDLFDAGRKIGLLAAPSTQRHGGFGLAEGRHADKLCRLLRLVGRIDLPLGRLYEGHVNALTLICRYARPTQVERFCQDARDGHLFGVWNTETGAGLRLAGGRLAGGKIFASGAGHVTRPLVTARTDDDQVLMVIPGLQPGERADLTAWKAQGMRASASGAVDFTGLHVGIDEIVGAPGDYLRQPMFSAGAWRFTAVQQGGIERVYDIWRDHLRSNGRADDPHQQARLGQGAIAVETARLWTERAAGLEHGENADQAVAYVNLARLAVERAGLDVLEGAQRSVGLAGFMRPHPLEQQARDLATYLRQPAPDRALVSAAAFVAANRQATEDLWADAR